MRSIQLFFFGISTLTRAFALPSEVSSLPSRALVPRATCTPTAGGSSSVDDTPAITSSLSTCGKGGTIVIPAGKTYYINTVLDFSSCVACDFQVEGTLKVSNNLTYWEGRRAIFYMSAVKTATVVSTTGTGVIDGNGQAAWEEFAVNSSYARPTLWYITGSSSITISDLTFKNPPNVFHSVTGSSTNVVYSGLTMSAVSTSSTVAHNTDGFDVGASTYVTIKNTTVVNDDDCVAFKSGTNYCTVDTITCTGSHGLSVGSLGGGVGATDSVKNVYVTNAKMINSAKAVGIKLYPAGASHGTATVSNVTWTGVTVTGCDYAAQIQSCYGETAAYCTSTPSTATLTDINLINFSGTTSSTYSPVTANMDCPASGTCGVTFENWTVKSPSGTAEVLCANNKASLGVTCTSGASG